MKLSKFFFPLVLISMLSSCTAYMQVFVNHESKYSKKQPITIVNETDDSGALGELQFALQSNGYKVMSMKAAKKALNIDTERDSDDTHSEITATTTFNSVYVIEMNYSYYIDPLTSRAHLHSFSANITDLATGEIIMTSRLNNSFIDCTVKQAVNLLVSEMNKVIR